MGVDALPRRTAAGRAEPHQHPQGKKMAHSTSLRSIGAWLVVLAGFSMFAAVCPGTSPAQAQCRTTNGQNDPVYPALQQTLDAYLAQRHGVEHLTGVSMHISRSATGPTSTS